MAIRTKNHDRNHELRLKDSKFSIVDNADQTKKLQFQCSGITTATTRTLTVPDASGTLATTAGSTFTTATLTSPVVNTPTLNLTAAALAALGTNQATAAPIVSASGAFIHATAADGTVGIRLPAATAGQVFFIKNSDAANAVLKVYPATGDAINAIAANTEIAMAAKTSAVFIALDTTTWYTISLLPS